MAHPLGGWGADTRWAARGGVPSGNGMAITLTEIAAQRVQRYLRRRGKGVGLRLGVRKTGCSGFAYVVNIADEVTDDDVVFEHRGVTVVVNSKHLLVLKGVEVDYVQEGLNEAFSFRNPNVKGECGCGESFNV